MDDPFTEQCEHCKKSIAYYDERIVYRRQQHCIAVRFHAGCFIRWRSEHVEEVIESLALEEA